MNPNYNQTITLYNCLKAADNPEKKDIWYRHVLSECYYKAAINRMESGARSGIGMIAAMQSVYTVRIPQSAAYRPYHEWAKLSEAERRQCFTGRLDDIVIVGNCEEEITGLAGQTATQVMGRYKPDAFKVTAFSDNTKVPMAKHYRLGG